MPRFDDCAWRRRNGDERGEQMPEEHEASPMPVAV